MEDEDGESGYFVGGDHGAGGGGRGINHHDADEEEVDFSTLHHHNDASRGGGSLFMRWKTKIGVAVLAIVGVAVVLSIILVLRFGSKDSNSNNNNNNNGGNNVNPFDAINAFQQVVSGDTMKAQMTNYSSLPHLAGTPNDYATAVYTLNKMLSYGLNATMEEIPVLLQYPLERIVQVLSPNPYNCTLEEAAVNDGTSGVPGAAPIWNGYSGEGDVTGELVYANYGRLEDYEALDAMKVNLSGKVVIVRYGQIFRGNKAQFAQQRGAVAVLIYIDPSDTGGPSVSDEYPNGPWSSNTTAQRGSVWNGNGDPLTPGWPSTKTSARITLEEAFDPQYSLDGVSGLPTIPIQPLSYGDAAHLFANLSGLSVPNSEWIGGFNQTTVGPGPTVVRVAVSVNYTVTSIWNVIGRIEGEAEPDRLVLIGAHRDAWTFGAGDPISGTTVVMEVARGLGQLLSTGWRPRRSIVLLSWDAEEYGLIGSVEYAELNDKSLSSQAVAYLNVDVAVQGTDYFGVSGSPSFLKLLTNVTQSVQVNSSHTVFDTWVPYELGLLGSGSDFTAFIQHLGIASLDGSYAFWNEAYEAVYHSNYDSIFWYENWGDPQFTYHAAMAKVWGSLLLRLSCDDLIPLDFTDYATTLSSLVDGLQQIAPNLDLSLMRASVSNFNNSANSIAKEISDFKSRSVPSATSDLISYILTQRSINDRLMLTERAFLGDSTITGLTWYDHVIFTPSASNSYAGVAFPTIQSAVLANQTAQAEFLVNRISQMIDGAATYLKGFQGSS